MIGASGSAAIRIQEQFGELPMNMKFNVMTGNCPVWQVLSNMTETPVIGLPLKFVQGEALLNNVPVKPLEYSIRKVAPVASLAKPSTYSVCGPGASAIEQYDA